MPGRRPSETVFAPSFLDGLRAAEDPPSAAEAEWAGDWKVVSLAEDRHLVLRDWQEPGRDAALGVFVERPAALLCAAVLPLEARPALFVVTRPVGDTGEYGILVRDTYAPSPAASEGPIGEVKELSEHQLFALHLAACLARSPHSLALLLEAAGPTAMRLVGEILARRLGPAT